MNYENLKLEKGMYAVPGKSFSQVLSSLDPDENYKDTSLEGLDAFGRQLKRFDIKVNGMGSDCVSKFFQTTSSAALFPEYVSRAVKQGMEEADALKDIVATVTKIDSLDYRSISSVPTEDEKELKDVAEGAFIPETNIRTNESLVKLSKRGRMLVASYEALKYQRLDLFTVTLKQIGAYIARSQMSDAINVLLNGDGNGNAAENIAMSGSEIAYSDLIKLYNSLDPYKLNTVIASPKMTEALLMLDEFKNPLSGFNFQGTGEVGTPLGAKFIRSSTAPETGIIGLDKNCALEMVVASDVSVDYDKLIDRQLERAAITSTAGFAKIFADACKTVGV